MTDPLIASDAGDQPEWDIGNRMLIISAGQRHALGLNARYPLLLPVGSVLEFDDVLDDQRVAGAGVIADQRGGIVCSEVDPVTGTPQGIAGTNPAGPVAFLRPRTAGHRPDCPARALQGPGASFPRRLPATGGPGQVTSARIFRAWGRRPGGRSGWVVIASSKPPGSGSPGCGPSAWWTSRPPPYERHLMPDEARVRRAVITEPAHAFASLTRSCRRGADEATGHRSC